MPSAASEAGGQVAADIVLGDCHGAACAPDDRRGARALLTRRGFAVALNAPYAGGLHHRRITATRGAAATRCRSRSTAALYMDERSYRKKPGFERLAAEMTALVAHLGQLTQACLTEAPRAAAG